jgi:hypothetical protein
VVLANIYRATGARGRRIAMGLAYNVLLLAGLAAIFVWNARTLSKGV